MISIRLIKTPEQALGRQKIRKEALVIAVQFGRRFASTLVFPTAVLVSEDQTHRASNRRRIPIINYNRLITILMAGAFMYTLRALRRC